MSLVPLKQWICDSCGELIADPKDGYVEWRKRDTDDGVMANGEQEWSLPKLHAFRIVHHKPRSPRGGEYGCYYPTAQRGGDMPLATYLGNDGMVRLLEWLAYGQVEDVNEWVDLVHRLHTPLFEEARQHWSDAEAEGFFGDYADAQDSHRYSQEVLGQLIRKYPR